MTRGRSGPPQTANPVRPIRGLPSPSFRSFPELNSPSTVRSGLNTSGAQYTVPLGALLARPGSRLDWSLFPPSAIQASTRPPPSLDLSHLPLSATTASPSVGPPSCPSGHQHVPSQPLLPVPCSGCSPCCSHGDPLKGCLPSSAPSIKYSSCSPQLPGKGQAREQHTGPCKAQSLLNPPVPLQPHPSPHALLQPHKNHFLVLQQPCFLRALKFCPCCSFCA